MLALVKRVTSKRPHRIRIACFIDLRRRIIRTIIRETFGEGFSMRRRLLCSVFTALLVLAISIIASAPAAAQGRGAQPRKPKPAVGAWWYKGDPQPQAEHPDLTGV